MSLVVLTGQLNSKPFQSNQSVWICRLGDAFAVAHSTDVFVLADFFQLTCLKVQPELFYHPGTGIGIGFSVSISASVYPFR